MTNAEPQHPAKQRKGWWTALGGTMIFIVAGLALIPGFARHERTSDPIPAVLDAWSQPTEPARDAPPAPANPPAAVPPESYAPKPVTHAFDCMIIPNEVVGIGSPITGRIEEILVERSDYVEQGQVLARLDSSVETAAMLVAQARAERVGELESSKVSLELGKKRRARARELFDSQALALDARQGVETEATLAALELERAQENHRIAVLQLEQARAALALRTIRSPISGFVVERLMAPGEIIDEQTMLRIAQVDPLRAEVILPSSFIGQIQPGHRAEITPEAPYDTPRVAEVLIVDRVIDGASGTFGARLILPNPGHELPAGLRCQVRLLDHEPSDTR